MEYFIFSIVSIAQVIFVFYILYKTYKYKSETKLYKNKYGWEKLRKQNRQNTDSIIIQYENDPSVGIQEEIYEISIPEAEFFEDMYTDKEITKIKSVLIDKTIDMFEIIFDEKPTRVYFYSDLTKH